MERATHTLPDDMDAIRTLVLNQQSKLEKKEEENHQYRIEIDLLREQIRLLLAKRYGPSSEKANEDQLGLFNEPEQEVLEATPVDEPEIEVPAHVRKKPGRKPLPASLPRIRIEHDLADADKHCPCGCHLTRIGEETSEQLDIIPAKVRVLQHVRFKYACRACEETILTAPMPPQPIPKSMASPGLLAHVAVAKYADALPLYRQERILQRIGVDIPRATLANWMIRLGDIFRPLIECLESDLIASPYIHCDETVVQVLNEPNRRAESQSYMWVRVNGGSNHPIVLFDYDPSRAGAVASRLLKGFKGYLQTDGYGGYAAIGQLPGISHVGCMAHARRKFDEALKAQGAAVTRRVGKADMGMAFMRKLYRIETEIRGKPPDQRYRIRQEKSLPVIREMRTWLDRSLRGVPPKTLLGKALRYLDNQWPKLIRYCDDGILEIDNNLAENAIRPFVVGRKNWLFSDSQAGAHASAAIYSIIETAKANGLEPYPYLRHLLEQLPGAKDADEVRALLPYHIHKNDLTAIAK